MLSKHAVLAILLLAVCTIRAQNPTDSAVLSPHEYVIQNFHTESGVVLPQAHVVYGTYGHLNTAGDNVVLLPSHFMADMHGYDWLIGPGLALDPNKLFLITSEMFGNGDSSSPSNTPEPFHGPRFPVMTIRDNVNAVHSLLTEKLKVQHLQAVIGFSMGAQQAFQWAVSYPTFMDRIVATSGTAKTYGHGIVRLEGQISAITLDPAFKAGDYPSSSEPTAGIQTSALVWKAWLFSQEWWRRELWRTNHPPETTFADMLAQARTGFDGNDANDLILQMRTWESNDAGKAAPFNANIEDALRSIKVPVLYMPSESDLYFPITDARYEAAFIPHCTLQPIPSLWGHTAGAGFSPGDSAFVNQHIAAFMSSSKLGVQNHLSVPKGGFAP
jgi:homoserine O-acetyltransferase